MERHLHNYLPLLSSFRMPSGYSLLLPCYSSHLLTLLSCEAIIIIISFCSKEHKSNRPKCQFLKLKDPYAITVGEVLDLERAALQHCIVSWDP